MQDALDSAGRLQEHGDAALQLADSEDQSLGIWCRLVASNLAAIKSALEAENFAEACSRLDALESCTILWLQRFESGNILQSLRFNFKQGWLPTASPEFTRPGPLAGGKGTGHTYGRGAAARCRPLVRFLPGHLPRR